MVMRVVNSGSIGNCYILENDTSALILEAGVRFTEVQQAINFNLKKVVGALVTHEHGDHSKCVKHYLDAAINVYASAGTIDALGIQHHRLHPVAAKQKFSLGAFTILPFDVKHDCAEPLGFLIHHPDCGNVLFITDSYYVAYKFPNLNHIMVEANYGRQILADRFAAGKLHSFIKDRVLKSHMSLETCKELLQANNLTNVNNIVLIHLSDANSDAALFKKEVQELTGKAVHIALPSVEVNFSLNPF